MITILLIFNWFSRSFLGTMLSLWYCSEIFGHLVLFKIEDNNLKLCFYLCASIFLVIALIDFWAFIFYPL